MGIMNRNLKQFPLKKEGFPQRLTLKRGDTQRTFYFNEAYYIDESDMEELFVSYKSLPWSDRRVQRER